MQIVPAARIPAPAPAAFTAGTPMPVHAPQAMTYPGGPGVPSLGDALKEAFSYDPTRASAYDLILESGRPPYDAAPIVTSLGGFSYDPTRLEALRAALGSPLRGDELGWFIHQIAEGFSYDPTRLSAVQLVSASKLPGRHLASIVETAIDLGSYDPDRLEYIRKGIDAAERRG